MKKWGDLQRSKVFCPWIWMRFQAANRTDKRSFRFKEIQFDDGWLWPDSRFVIFAFYTENWSNPAELNPRKTNGWNPKIETVWSSMFLLFLFGGVFSGVSNSSFANFDFVQINNQTFTPWKFLEVQQFAPENMKIGRVPKGSRIVFQSSIFQGRAVSFR